MIYRGPGFLAVVWFGSSFTPSPPFSRLSFSVFLCVGCLWHFVYSKFRIFRMFFLFRIPFENGPNFAKLYEIFLCKSIQNSAVFWEILWLVIPIFFKDAAQTTFSTHSRETSRRWLGVGEVPGQYTPQLGCLRHFVFSKFRIFWMFFLFCIPFENILFGSGFEFQFLLFFIQF